jgi:hypothetical protein
MPETAPNFRVFRIYFSTQSADKEAPAFIIYWDTTTRRKALIDPFIFIYEHASMGDLLARLPGMKSGGYASKRERFVLYLLLTAKTYSLLSAKSWSSA